MRGKAGRGLRRLAGFQATLKGLPSAYNRDLQEDKEALFDAVDTTRGALRALAAVLPRLGPVPARGLPEEGGDLLATDRADEIMARGVPFAEAHRLAGEEVASARAEAAARARPDRPSPADRPPGALTVSASLARRDREGGTAPARVAEELGRIGAWAAARLASGLRLRPADEDDLPLLEARIKTYSDQGALLPLAGRALRSALPDFRVLSEGGEGDRVLAFGALRRYSPRLAEIRSLVVSEGQRGRGHGRRLVTHLLDEARHEGRKRVFVLTRTPDFFE